MPADKFGYKPTPQQMSFAHLVLHMTESNNYLIDGISVADYAFGELTYTPLPNPDAIQEFKVSTSLYELRKDAMAEATSTPR